VQDVAEHRGLLEHVGAVRDDDADPAPGRVARRAADAQLVVQRQVRGGLVEDRDRLQVREGLQAGDGGDEAVRVELRSGAVALAHHGDGATGGQDPDAPDGRGAAVGRGQHQVNESTDRAARPPAPAALPGASRALVGFVAVHATPANAELGTEGSHGGRQA
jgi:hypothetical protein